MHNHGPRVGRFLALLATALVVVMLAVGSAPDSATRAVGPAGPYRVLVPAIANDSGQSQAQAAKALAQGIVHPESLVAGVHALEQALSRAGIASGTFDQILVPAIDPATPEVVLTPSVLNLELEASASTIYRMTADDLGDMLADFGWPFAATPSRGEQVVAMLAAMVDGARQDPHSPMSFAPLLLDELTQLKDAPYDLSGGTVAPEDVQLNLLDLKLFASVFDRASVKPVGGQVAASASDTPCTDAKNNASGLTSPFGGYIHGIELGQPGSGFIPKALEAAGVSKDNAAAVKQALSIVSIISKIWKLLEFYSNAKVNVTLADGGPKITHKFDEEDALQLRLFKATAGVSEKDWKEYLDSFDAISRQTSNGIRDCLGTYGLKMPADLGDLVKESENWKVDWSVKSGKNRRGQPNAWWTDTSQPDPGTVHALKGAWQTSPRKVSEYSAETRFVMDIGTERKTDHPAGQKFDDVKACADVISATPPDLQTFLRATKGLIGVIESAVDLGAGWMRTIAPPSSCAALGVTWHETCASALQAAALGVRAAAGEVELPCAYEGSASATDLDPFISPDVSVITASNLRFELVPPLPDAPPGEPLRYELVRGNVTVQVSSADGGCTWSGGFSISQPMDDGVHYFGGNITVDPLPNKYSAFGSVVDSEHHVVLTCGGGSPFVLPYGYGAYWLRTMLTGGDPNRSFTPGGPLEGSFDWDSPGLGDTGHSQWSLHPADDCAPSPQPTCQ